MTAAATAIAAIGRCLDALQDAPGDAERRRILALANEARRLLEASAGGRRISTEAVAARVQALESELDDRQPGERREIICERLGIGRATYYRLRKSHQRETAAR